MVFLRPMTIQKNGVNSRGNGFAVGDANTKTDPIKCLIFQSNEESFTFDIFKIAVSINWKLEH